MIQQETIRKVLREESSIQIKLKNMINKYGLINAAKSVGGVDNLEKIMGDFGFMTNQMKIDAIVEIVDSEKYLNEELDLYEAGLEPIIIAEYEDTNDFLQIEIVTTYGVIAMYYNHDDGFSELGDTTIQYDGLDPEVVDTIFESVLWWYLEG
jgi:hypothetical protein